MRGFLCLETDMKTRLPLPEAQRLANVFLDAVRPFCERAEVAGSVRRGEAEVGDIEVVIQPILTPIIGLFGEQVGVQDALAGFNWSAWGQVLKNGERYKQILTPKGISLDVFIVLPPAQWGLIYLIRTGPAAFSQWAVTPRRKGGGLPSHLQVKDGAIWHGKRLIPTPTEADVFKVLGMEYIPPAERKPRWQWREKA